MNYTHLTNEELASHADLALDPLTSTELERELIKRFDALIEENRDNSAGVEVLNDFNLDPNTTADIEQIRDALQFYADYPAGRALLDVLTDFDIDAPEALRAQLERLSKFDRVMQDLVEPITTLQSLATT